MTVRIWNQNGKRFETGTTEVSKDAPKCLAIRNWDKHFEVSQTRKVDSVRWIPVPVKHDGLGFRFIMTLEDGLAVFGAWNLILQVAAKCKPRGVLISDAGRPLSARDIALKTGAPVPAIERAFQVLATHEVGWLIETDTSRVESDSSALDYRRGEDRTGQDTCCAGSSEPPAAREPAVMVFPTVGESSQWNLPLDHVANLREAFPHLDVLAECKKALAWCKANERQRKTPRGMPKFLFGWMSRTQNRQRGGEAAKIKPEDGYREVDAEEFRRLHDEKRFKVKPRKHADGYWYGQLYDGGKVKVKA